MFTTLGVIEVVPSLDGLSRILLWRELPAAGLPARRCWNGWCGAFRTRTICSRSLSPRGPIRCPAAWPNSLHRIPRWCCARPRIRSAVWRLSPGSFPCHGIVRLAVSDPFVDPILIDRLITAVASDEQCDYACFVLGDGRPAHESRMGIFADWCRRMPSCKPTAWPVPPPTARTRRNSSARIPKSFHIKQVPVPARLDRGDLRLAIRDEEDWENVETILDALGPESLDWQFITSLLDRHPANVRADGRAQPS